MSIVEKPLLATTSLWLVGLCAISSALAVPPAKAPFGRPLDLSPPHAVESFERAAPIFSATLTPLRYRQMPGRQEPLQLPILGTDSMRSGSRVEDFVHRVHKEGLPVARLFESKSALVHVGLSPRGKPGLWLVQKTH
jgi:hypothetical protein